MRKTDWHMSRPPFLPHSHSLFLFLPTTPSVNNTLRTAPSLHLATLEKAGLLIVQSRVLGASCTRRLRMRGVSNLDSVSSSHLSSSFFFRERVSWSSRVRIHFMTNEIPKALARNNGLFGWREAVWEEVVVEGGAAKTGFQPLQLSRLSLLVLKLTPGSRLQPRGSRGCVWNICVRLSVHPGLREILRGNSLYSEKTAPDPDTEGKLNDVKTPSVWRSTPPGMRSPALV